MRLRRSWNVAVVLAAVSLMVTLQVVGAAQTGTDVAGPVPNTAALGTDGAAGGWSAFVALIFLVVADLMALGRRQPRRRPDEQRSATPWERLVAARY